MLKVNFSFSKQILAFAFVMLTAMFGQQSFAQLVTGKVIDQVTKEPLFGVTITNLSSKKVTATGTDGSFKMKLTEAASLEFTSVGYLTKVVMLKANQNLGVVELVANQMAMKEVVVSSNIAIDRKTPVAVSTVRSATIEEKIGGKEFVEVLRLTPSTFITRQGGGFGDSRINVRGFSQENVAVMINGVPVNDMENSRVYWSNWAGLSDIASNMQVQRGLGASKLSIAAIGGNINIVTKATEMQQGGVAGITVGNDGYVKTQAGYSSGKNKDGFAFSVLASNTMGAGYVNGTSFNAYNYFATLGWEINSKHTVTLTATGAPQWHNQRSGPIAYQTIFGNPNDATVVVRGIKYNDSWGFYKGKEFSASKNFYHKPVANLNHYWKINSSTNLNSVVYASWGDGGGTGALGSINGKNFFTLPKDANGQIRFDDIEKWNTGNAVADFGTTAATRQNTPWATPGSPYMGSYVGNASKGLIRRSSMNNHNWYGLISNLSKQLDKNIEVNVGIDLRSYRGLHYRRLEDNLGVAAWNDGTKDVNELNKFVSDKNTPIDYNNDGLVKQYGGYASVEYTSNKLTIFSALSASNTDYKRVDYFLYKPTDDLRTSIKKSFFGYVAKAGANYRFDNMHNVFVNVGYFEKAPFFNTVFINNNNKDFPNHLTNEKITSFEAGYGLRSQAVSLNINAYYTKWKDKNFVKNFTDAGVVYRTNISGLIAEHKGVELEATVRPTKKLTVIGMASIGDWKYKNDVTANVVDDNNKIIGTTTIYTKGIKVGDAAQTTAGVEAVYDFFKGFRARASYYYYDNLYAGFTPENRSSVSDAGRQAWQLPAYGLLDAVLSYQFKVANRRITFRLNVDNVLDKQYIAESQDDVAFKAPTSSTIPTPPANEFEIGKGGSGVRNRVFAGFGRTWTLGFKVNF